jgi:hypothetical protein
MAFVLTRIQVNDYDDWKQMFDSDPPGARKTAKGHRILRAVGEPNEVFVQVEFRSSDEANTARERLLASGVLDRVRLVAGPTSRRRRRPSPTSSWRLLVAARSAGGHQRPLRPLPPQRRPLFSKAKSRLVTGQAFSASA